MAPFTRANVPEWHIEVPGTRWFRADLHLHTLDDWAGGHVAWQVPPHLIGRADPSDPDTRAEYVRAFLKAACQAGIQVLGLTPHSAHVSEHSDLSVAWEIVEAWQTTADDDGIPFRQKIYAVFPGFEPSASDGSRGIHLLVLFDPEIGKQRYLKAFTVATGGQEVWRNGALHPSTMDTQALLASLADLQRREADDWDYLCIHDQPGPCDSRFPRWSLWPARTDTCFARLSNRDLPLILRDDLGQR